MTSTQHLTAEEIFLQAHKAMPSIAFGTVYRNLALMVECGDIGKVELVGASARYDRSSIPHAHARCVKCGRLDDVDLNDIKPLIECKVHNLVNYHLDINYICDNCID